MKTVWKNHGTKVIGAIGVIAGAIATVDPATITAFLTAIFGDRGPGIATGILGAVTIWRGFTNGKANQPKETTDATPPSP